MEKADFYEVLNIHKDASLQEIRRAYKELVKKWHPDKHPPSSKLEAEARFKAISQAYESLSDQDYRTVFGVYNEVADGWAHKGSEERPPTKAAAAASEEERLPRNETPRKESKQSGWDTARKEFKNVYYANMAAPARMPASGSSRRKPPPEERKLECTLEELCRGCKKEIAFTRDVVTKDGLIAKKQEIQTIKVKPGWKKGTKITFEGMGDEQTGCIPADVVYVVAEKEHPVFKRVGNDLVLKVEVPLVNALTGWTFAFRLLDGEKMSFSFADEIIHPGFEKVVSGQGMPLAGGKGARGDLRIKFHVSFPKKLTKEQRTDLVEILKNCN